MHQFRIEKKAIQEALNGGQSQDFVVRATWNAVAKELMTRPTRQSNKLSKQVRGSM
jgi:hypothetical protein